MSYRGFIPLMCSAAGLQYKLNVLNDHLNVPIRILEIGVMDGLTTIPLAINLKMMNVPYIYEGIDIWIRNSVLEHTNNIIGLRDHLRFHEINSLEFFKELDKEKATAARGWFPYDIVLIDGDHNYETVSQECKWIKNFIHSDTVIIFDDYHGRGGDTDTYYADHKDYKNVAHSTPSSVNSPRHGVRSAVDEFLEETEYYGFGLELDPGGSMSSPIVVISPDNKVVPAILEELSEDFSEAKSALEKLREQALSNGRSLVALTEEQASGVWNV